MSTADFDFFTAAQPFRPLASSLEAAGVGTSSQTTQTSGGCMCVCKSGMPCSRAAKTEFNSMRMCNIHYNMFKTREDSCSICLEHMTRRNYTKLGACGHLFHSSCIVEWGSRGNESCPCCRKTMCVADIIAVNQKTTDYIGSIIFSLPSKNRRDLMLKNVMDVIVTTFNSFNASDVIRAQTGQLRPAAQTAQIDRVRQSSQSVSGVDGSDDEDLDEGEDGGNDEIDDVDRDPDFVPTMIDIDV